MKIAFVEPALPKTGSLVVGILEERELTPTAADIDRRCGGALKRAMEFSRFRGKREQMLDVLVPQGLAIGRVVLVGLGKASELDEGKAEAIGGVAVAHLNRVGEKTATIAIDKLARSGLAPAALAARVALGASLRAYRFDKYKTKEEKDKKPSLATRPHRGGRPGGRRARLSAAREDRRGRVLHPRPGVRAGQHHLSRDARQGGEEARKARRRGRDPRREADGQARHGRAARRRPGQRPAAAPRRHAMARRRPRPRSRSPSSARASPSTPAASRSSRPPAWKT